jgi:hypothetical protein
MKQKPIFACERTAAGLLSLKLKEFRELIDIGVVPAPILIGGKFPRWHVQDLETRLNGNGSEEQFAW